MTSQCFNKIIIIYSNNDANLLVIMSKLENRGMEIAHFSANSVISAESGDSIATAVGCKIRNGAGSAVCESFVVADPSPDVVRLGLGFRLGLGHGK